MVQLVGLGVTTWSVGVVISIKLKRIVYNCKESENSGWDVSAFSGSTSQCFLQFVENQVARNIWLEKSITEFREISLLFAYSMAKKDNTRSRSQRPITSSSISSIKYIISFFIFILHFLGCSRVVQESFCVYVGGGGAFAPGYVTTIFNSCLLTLLAS